MEGASGRSGVLLLMPRDARKSTGPVSVWLTAAGWAEAADELHGAAWLVTPSGVLSPGQARLLATSSALPGRRRPRWKRLLPRFLATLRSDFRAWRHQRRFASAGLNGPWESGGLAWVWQHHEPFNSSGFRAAARFGCPVVLFVDAPVVWEGRKWGSLRPGWGWWIERFGERPALLAADIVACVTEEVAREVLRLGADPSKVLVTPCAVDLKRFNPTVQGDNARRSLGLSRDHLIVGWVGTFHGFHGLDLLIQAFLNLSPDYPTARLVVVGDGQERPRLLELIATAQATELILMPGAVPQHEVPGYIAAMDVCAIVDPGRRGFHYSPLKLQEYLACGRAVVVPQTGQMARDLEHERHALLIPPGDSGALELAIRRLFDDPALRDTLGHEGAAKTRTTGTWLQQVARVDARLRDIMKEESALPTPPLHVDER